MTRRGRPCRLGTRVLGRRPGRLTPREVPPVSSRRLHLDANVAIRLLRADHPEHSPAARELFAAAEAGRCTLVLDPVVVAEIVWVLTSFYRVERSAVADVLPRLLARRGVSCPDRAVLEQAFERYASTKLDLIDCYLIARAETADEPIAAFDRKLRRVAGGRSVEPGSLSTGDGPG